MKTLTRIILKTKKDQSLRRRHPWIFSGAIKKIKNSAGTEYQPVEGEMVEVFSNHDEYLATGHYQTGSIAVRVFSFERIVPDFNFWSQKLRNALCLRADLGLLENEHTNTCRLVFAEGDELPGLIIDYYNGTAVLQCHSVGMHKLRDTFTTVLKDYFGNKLKAVYDKSAETLRILQYSVENGYLYQKEGTCDNIIKENDCLFKVDWEQGQKTGFFIDQRENRQLLAQFSKDKRVLNTFCYTGGFSVYALKAGARLVHSVDSSAKAIALTDENVELNKLKNHQSFKSDTLQYLQGTDEQYDIIVLDPPAYAKHRNVRHKAVQGYKRLNALAMQKIAEGGILFTFSCSQVVDKKLFYDTITAAAIQSGRNISVIHQLGQPPDHPVSIFHPEGEYLKGLVLRIIK